MKEAENKEQPNSLGINIDCVNGRPNINLDGANRIDNKIKDIDVEQIVAYLQAHQDVTAINLSNNNLTGRGLITLLRGVAGNTSLTNIDFSNNNIAIFEAFVERPYSPLDVENPNAPSHEITNENGLLAREEKAARPHIEIPDTENRTSEWQLTAEEKRQIKQNLHNVASQGLLGLVAVPINNISRDARILASTIRDFGTDFFNIARVETGNIARINDIKDALRDTAVSSLNLAGNPCRQNREFNSYWPEIQGYLDYNRGVQAQESEVKATTLSSVRPSTRPQVSICSRLNGNIGLVLNSCAIS